MKKIIACASFVGVMMSVACNKDATTAPGTGTSTSASPYASVKIGHDNKDGNIWTYEGSDGKLTRIKWDNLSGATPFTESDISSITYEGTKLAKIVSVHQPYGTATLTITYDGDKIKEVSEVETGGNYSFSYLNQPEYDTQGRIAQWNSTPAGSTTSTSYVFTYDANNNISKMVKVSGTNKTTYSYKYDTKENKAYNNLFVQLTCLTNRSGTLGTFWNEVMGLSKNNVIETTFEGNGTSIITPYNYTYDASGNLTRVEQASTAAGAINNYWILTTK